MYKVKKEYTSDPDHPQTLSIKQGEVVYLINKPNEHWWLVSNEDNCNGYVPPTSLTSISSEQSNRDGIVLTSIERAIDKIKLGSSDHQHQLIKELEAQKESLIRSSSSQSLKRRAPPPPTRNTPRDCARVSETVASSQPKMVNSFSVPDNFGRQLVNCVEQMTKATSQTSARLVRTLLSKISDEISEAEPLVESIMATIGAVENDDLIELELELTNLQEIADNAQDRNWSVRDDDDVIIAIVERIQTLMVACEGESCAKMMMRDDCFAIRTLALYYQMESKFAIKKRLLEVIGFACCLSSHLKSFVVTSIIPSELISDILNHSKDEERLLLSSQLLALILTADETLPPSLEDRLSMDFCCHLLDRIEEESSSALLSLLLAINIHFSVPDKNEVMKALKRKTHINTSQEMMLMINDGGLELFIDFKSLNVSSSSADPLCNLTNEERNPHSVIKFLNDVFLEEELADDFIYTNDFIVLIDIVTRNIVDLSCGYKRSEFLELFLNMSLKGGERKLEIEKRWKDLKKVFSRILEEEEDKEVFQFEKELVLLIQKQFK